MLFDGRIGLDDAPTTAIVVAEARSDLMSASDGFVCGTAVTQDTTRVRTAIAVERTDVDGPPIGAETPRNRTATIQASSCERQRRVGRDRLTDAHRRARGVEDVEQTGIHGVRPLVGGAG